MPSSTGTLVFNDQKIQAPDIYATESLGVGVSDPTSNLEVVGNAYVSSNLEVGTANLFVDTVSGRVGVGVTDPQNILTIKQPVPGGATGSSDLQSNAAISIRGYLDNADALSIGLFDVSDPITGNNPTGYIQNVWDNGGDGRPFVINPAGGNVGIGTTNPGAKLDVRGDIFGPGIIQVQSTTFNGIASGNSNSFTKLAGLTTSITPKRSGSKIMVLLNLFWSGGADAYFQGNVKKNGSVLVKQEGSVGNASKTSFGMLNYDRAQYFLGNIGFSYLDDSNIGTQQIEYTVEVRNRFTGSQYWYINYTSNTGDANRLTGVSTLTLIEIQQ